MALKKQHEMMSIFSMASMTDVIFLLLIFFMVTSTFVFPSALEVNLPQSSEQSAIKPGTRVYIDKELCIYATIDETQATSRRPTDGISATRAANRAREICSPLCRRRSALRQDSGHPRQRLAMRLENSARHQTRIIAIRHPRQHRGCHHKHRRPTTNNVTTNPKQ